VNLGYIDWIWRVRGSVALAPGQSIEQAFDRLDPLFQEAGTSHERTANTLTFSKKDQAAQDKMSVFDGGVLQIETGEAGSFLRYQLTSRILLFCFLAPLLFLGISQLTVAVGKHEKPPIEKPEKAKKASDVPMNAFDKALGAPVAEKKDKKAEAKDKEEKRKRKYSPTPAYVFAGIFAVLYAIGRILEAALIKAQFRKRLLEQGCSVLAT
jgi:hypothetical protein